MHALLNKRHKKSEILELIGHFCVGLSIFMKGIDKIEHEHVAVGIILLFAGLLVFAFSLNHEKVESRLGNIKYVIWGVEGVVMGLVGYSYYQDGTHLLHYAYFFVAIMYICVIPFHYYMQSSKKKDSSKQLSGPDTE
jgi:hypothetical protein